jgi:hypothetical protein
MDALGTIFGHKGRRRALVILGCLALLYFVAGTTLHSHTSGTDGLDTACHICQALHMPALAAAALDLLPGVEQVTWHASLPQHATPSDSFSLHRASRAPPVS